MRRQGDTGNAWRQTTMEKKPGDGSNKYDGRGNQLKSSMYKNAIRKPVTFCG